MYDEGMQWKTITKKEWYDEKATKERRTYHRGWDGH